MTDSSPSPTILTTREIRLHLGGFILFFGLLALWYWLSTGARAVPALIEMLKDDAPSTRIVVAEQLGSGSGRQRTLRCPRFRPKPNRMAINMSPTQPRQR